MYYSSNCSHYLNGKLEEMVQLCAHLRLAFTSSMEQYSDSHKSKYGPLDNIISDAIKYRAIKDILRSILVIKRLNMHWTATRDSHSISSYILNHYKWSLMQSMSESISTP